MFVCSTTSEVSLFGPFENNNAYLGYSIYGEIYKTDFRSSEPDVEICTIAIILKPDQLRIIDGKFIVSFRF